MKSIWAVQHFKKKRADFHQKPKKKNVHPHFFSEKIEQYEVGRKGERNKENKTV